MRIRCVLMSALCVISLGCARPTMVATPVPAAAPAPVATMPAIPASTPRVVMPLQSFVDSLVNLPQFSSAHWGVLIVAPDRRDTLAALQADRLVMPASNQKLITAAVGLSSLGPDYQWRTTFTRTGPIVNGVLRGDLVITGRGDPSVSVSMRTDPLTAFDSLVSALRAAGVRRIAGRVAPDVRHTFPGSPLGYGWDWDDLDAAYGAGVTELLFNEGFTDVSVVGCGAVARKACVTTAPLRHSPPIHSLVTTLGRGTGAPVLEWWRDSLEIPGITVRGAIAAGDSMQFSASQPDERATYAAAVVEALARAGIAATDGAERPAGRDTVFVLHSLPLRDVLSAMQKPSQNQIAEALFRTIALESTGLGRPDSARAVVERQLAAWGVRSDAHAIRDGSGLSRHDYLTPRLVVQVLDTMRRGPHFRVYRDALPVAGVDGTLENRMRTFAAGRVFAKTGTIDKARALSGYVTTAGGEEIIFSIIANNFTVPNREVDRIAELIVERLVAMDRTER